jgi:hypothetical protein
MTKLIINGMKIHELKTIEPYFSQVETGEKTFEIRYNDRNYQKGDYLLLQKYDGIMQSFNGESLLVRVKYVLKDYHGLSKDMCIMSISKPLE